MSPAAAEKLNGFRKIAETMLTPLVALVAILAIILIAPLYFRSDARPDPWTGSQHLEYSKLVDERIAHLEEAANEYERFKKDWETIRAEHMAIHHHTDERLTRPPCLKCGRDHPTTEHPATPEDADDTPDG